MTRGRALRARSAGRSPRRAPALFVAVVAAALAQPGSAPGEDGPFEPPLYRVLRAGGPIAIDGRLDEADWFAAPDVGEFRFPWWSGGRREQTVAKLLWDDAHLYVAHVCEDAHIAASHRDHDGAVAEDDCFEVMVAPDPGRPDVYFNIEWNVVGGWVDNHRPHGPKKPRAEAWDATGLRIAGRHVGTLGDDSDRDAYWIVEAAIPLASFAGVASRLPPLPGTSWNLNLNRHGGSTNVQYSQWSPADTPTPSFHTPHRFGRIIFASEPASPAADLERPVLAAGSKVERVASGYEFTEGPTVDRSRNVYFSDRPNDRILKLSPDGEVVVHRQPCGAANGLAVDARDRLVLCQSSGEGGGRAVVRIEADGELTVLASRYGGRRFIGPNDLAIDAVGRIWFTDPWYGPPAEKSQPSSGVYRIDAPGEVELVVSSLERPNGIALSPDERQVYVSDRGTQRLHRFDVLPEGRLTPAGVVYDFAPDRGIDGMCIDVEGNIYGAAGRDATTGLFVISPGGRLLLHRPMPEFATNVTFGGADRRELYFTAGGSLYRLRAVRPGVPRR